MRRPEFLFVTCYFFLRVKLSDTTHTRCRMERRDDDDDRYSEPLYYDSVHNIWVNEQYEPIELPSTQRPLHGGELGPIRPEEDVNQK